MTKTWEQWTPEEDEALRIHYPHHGAAWEGWKTVLHGRSPNAINNRANGIGVHLTKEAKAHIQSDAAKRRSNNSPRCWSHAEDAAITEHYPAHGPSWDGWAELLPNRTKGAITRRANKMGVFFRGSYKSHRRRFTDAERSRLLKTVIRLADAIGATPYDVAMELVELGREYGRGAA